MVDCDGAISLPSAIATATANASSSSSSSSRENPPVLPTLAVENTPQEKTSSSEVNQHHQPQVNILEPPKSTNAAVDRPSSSRRPRGRPPGSKNKPKTPLIFPRETEPSIKTVVLEVSPGYDIVDSIVDFTRRQPAIGFMVVSASGSVSNVTLRHPVTNAPAISIHGPLNILALTGTYFGSYQSHSMTNSFFGITVNATQGQVYGGVVAGKVIAASRILVVGTTFRNPLFYRLPFGTIDNVDHSIQQLHVGGGVAGGAGAAGGGADHRNPGTPIMAVYGVANPAPVNTVTPIAPRP